MKAADIRKTFLEYFQSKGRPLDPNLAFLVQMNKQERASQPRQAPVMGSVLQDKINAARRREVVVARSDHGFVYRSDALLLRVDPLVPRIRHFRLVGGGRQGNDVFAGDMGREREAPEAGAVGQAVDQQRDHPGLRMLDAVFHVIEHRHVGLVPRGGEQRQAGAQHRQPPGHGVEERAGVGEDRNPTGLLALGVRGIEPDRERVVRVVDAVAVGADDADTCLGRDALEFALAFGAAGIEAFGIAGGPDDDGLQPGTGAVADGLDGGVGGDDPAAADAGRDVRDVEQLADSVADDLDGADQRADSAGAGGGAVFDADPVDRQEGVVAGDSGDGGQVCAGGAGRSVDQAGLCFPAERGSGDQGSSGATGRAAGDVCGGAGQSQGRGEAGVGDAGADR